VDSIFVNRCMGDRLILFSEITKLLFVVKSDTCELLVKEAEVWVSQMRTKLGILEK